MFSGGCATLHVNLPALFPYMILTMCRSTVAWPRLTIQYEMTYTQLHQGINWIYFRFTARDQIQDCQGIMALERNPCILISLIMRKVAVFRSSVWLQTLDLLCQEGSRVIYKYYRTQLSEVLCFYAPFIYFLLLWPVSSLFSYTKSVTYGITGSIYFVGGQCVHFIFKTILKIGIWHR